MDSETLESMSPEELIRLRMEIERLEKKKLLQSRDRSPKLEHEEYVFYRYVIDACARYNHIIDAQLAELEDKNAVPLFPGVTKTMIRRSYTFINKWLSQYPYYSEQREDERIHILRWIVHRVVGVVREECFDGATGKFQQYMQTLRYDIHHLVDVFENTNTMTPQRKELIASINHQIEQMGILYESLPNHTKLFTVRDVLSVFSEDAWNYRVDQILPAYRKHGMMSVVFKQIVEQRIGIS